MVATVIESVARDAKLDPADITSRARFPYTVRARMAAAWLALHLCPPHVTRAGIAKAFGRSGAESITSLIKAAELGRRTDPTFRQMTNRLLDEIRDASAGAAS